MIVINDDSSDDDEFKPLPSLLRAVASPVEVRDDDDATRRDDDGWMDGDARATSCLEFKRGGPTDETKRNDTRRAIDGDDDADEETNGDAADDRGRRWIGKRERTGVGGEI